MRDRIIYRRHGVTIHYHDSRIGPDTELGLGDDARDEKRKGRSKRRPKRYRFRTRSGGTIGG